jgi:hypothetical protein
MKNFFFALFICLSVNAGAQKLIGSSVYNHDTTGYVFKDSMSMYYKAANTTTSLQDYQEGNISAKSDSMHGYSGMPLTLNYMNKDIYDAGYTRLLVASSEGYTAGVPVSAYTNTFYYNGIQLDSSVFINTDLITNVSTLSNKYIYRYNAQNQQDTVYYIYFNNVGAYSSSYKNVQVYVGNNMTEQWIYNSTDSVTYTPSTKYMNYYNANGMYDSVVSYAWIGANWIKQNKRTFGYNANQQVILKHWYGFDQNLQTYLVNAREELMRSNNTQLDTMFSQNWNQATQKFDTTIKRGFVYQGGVQLRSYAYNLNPNTMLWQPNPYNAVLNYYYDMIPNKTAEYQSENTLMLYPNPADNILYFRSDMQGKRYNICSHDGRMLQSGVISTNNQIQIQNLPAGIYSLVVENGQVLSKSMFVKQ